MTDQGKDLSPDQWRRVKEVFGAALEREPAERVAFLDEACGTGEAAVRREVEALLAAHVASDHFLETPAAAVASPTPSHRELAEGQTLGPYRVLRTLGHGGMATVYLARDERHHRSVALKVLHSDLAHALGAERFLREIEVAANLTHPHILPLHDSGEAAGLLYYVMPYVEGESLRDRLRRETQLPVDEALQIAREVADALAYAHGQGVIHRDIKPENILLGAGHAQVADFGIARALSQADSARLTESGMAIGTAAYMSPEQASAASHIDGRSDVYSLGCVVYEMLAGEPPYTGPTAQAIIAKRFSDPVPQVRRVRPSVPGHVDRAVARALAPVPADRFATAAEFAWALRPSPAGPATGPTVPLAAAIAGRGRRRVPVAAMTLGLGILIGLGMLFAWRRSHPGAGEIGGTRVVAVLPFENLGDSADTYFADGVANELRTKLTQIRGLQVIARGSSNEYKRTTKPQQQIARELGVDYLLTATVQWEKVAGGASRVRVSPELVDVRPGHAPQSRWGQQFDAAMTDVFQVQADIAEQVAQALHVAFGDSTKRDLAAKPTRNLAAYDAFLKAEEVSQSLGAIDTPTLTRAIAYYEQAVALDSTFVEAWAQLSRSQSTLYYYGVPTPRLAERSRAAAEQALILSPNGPEGHVALGTYYVEVTHDFARAREEYALGQQAVPNNADLLVGTALVEQSLGRWEEALPHLERAQRLDPRSIATTGWLAKALLWLRRYPEALEAVDRGLAVAPANLDFLEIKAMIALGRGDLTGARRVIASTPKDADPATLVAFFANSWDLYWVLDDIQQQLLFHLTPNAFNDDRATWGLVLAQTYSGRGDRARARAYADSARIATEQQLRALPKDPQRHLLLGLALAYFGRKPEAVQEGLRGVALLPIAQDSFYGAYLQHQLARIYVLVNEPEKALDQLEPLLNMPYYLSPGWLKIDPNFAPLRDNPRFERLVNGS
jgi:eukaryotic-like serine/threonine-protein kinase